jgi:hypothetical protein
VSGLWARASRGSSWVPREASLPNCS